MENPKPLKLPPSDWIRRLRKGCWIWLSKEGQHARVMRPWDPPEPGTISGELYLQRLYDNRIERWHVKENGAGFDGKQLVEPCEGEGNLPEAPEPLDPKDLRDMQFWLGNLEHRLDMLERVIVAICTGMPLPAAQMSAQPTEQDPKRVTTRGPRARG